MSTLVRLTRGSAFRFLVVGVASLIADAGLLYVLHGRLGIWLPAATAIAFLGGFAVNFFLNRYWSFGGANGQMGGQLVRFFGLIAVNLLFTVLLVQGLTTVGVPYLVGKVMTTAVLSTANYFISRKWIFI